MFKNFIKYLVDHKEGIVAGVAGIITALGIIFLPGCVAGDSVVKEIAYCVKNVCTIKGVPVMIDEPQKQQ